MNRSRFGLEQEEKTAQDMQIESLRGKNSSMLSRDFDISKRDDVNFIASKSRGKLHDKAYDDSCAIFGLKGEIRCGWKNVGEEFKEFIWKLWIHFHWVSLYSL